MKTISVYQLDNHKEVLAQLKEDQTPFMTYRFRGCGAMDKEQRGFTENITDGQYVSEVDGNIVLTITTQQKKANKNLIKSLEEASRLDYIATTRTAMEDPEYDVVIDKQTEKSFKQEAADQALQAAFPEEAKHNTVVFRPDGLVLVEGAGNAAEMLLSLIRKSLGSLKVIPYEPETPVADLLDDWVKTEVCDLITLGEKCELITADGAKAVFSKGYIAESEASEFLINKGAFTESLQINYDGAVTCVINGDFVFKGLKYDACIVDKEEEATESTNFILTLAEINKMINEVIKRLAKKEEA